MSDLIGEIKSYLKQKGIPVVGGADADALNKSAPEGFRPGDYLPEAKTLIVFGTPPPLAVYKAPYGRPHDLCNRSFATVYNVLDEAAHGLAQMLEAAGHRSAAVPSYTPLRFYQGEPRGTISLKHAAAAAGLGKIGKNTLLIHPEHGNILRLAGVLTALPWPAAEPVDLSRLCPDGCTLCIKACPIGALRDGSIEKTECMVRCVRHVLMPPRPVMLLLRNIMRRSPGLSRYMELFSLNLIQEYSVACMECLLACPRFPGFKAESRKPAA